MLSNNGRKKVCIVYMIRLQRQSFALFIRYGHFVSMRIRKPKQNISLTLSSEPKKRAQERGETLNMYTQMSNFKMQQHAIGIYSVTPVDMERIESNQTSI